MNNKVSTTSSYSYHITHMQLFERRYSVVKRSLESSTLNEGPFCLRNEKKDEEVYSTLEQRIGGETST